MWLQNWGRALMAKKQLANASVVQLHAQIPAFCVRLLWYPNFDPEVSDKGPILASLETTIRPRDQAHYVELEQKLLTLYHRRLTFHVEYISILYIT